MVLFISDVHLGFFERNEDKIIEDKLIAFLSSIPEQCKKLLIVGDLFDYWFEYKTVIPRIYIRTLAELYNLKKRNIEIEFIIGNHDFGLIDFFETELDIKTYREDIEREFYGKKFYISHGDGKSENDTGYKILKSILRHQLSMRLFQVLHPDFGIYLAKYSSQKSRKHTDKKNYGNDSMIKFAKQKNDEGFDYVVMGHCHKPIIIKNQTGSYINLGAWMKEPQFGIFDGEVFKLLDFDYFIKKKL
ncbi:MAG: UDP-2,3-diacylglucosamine diphosphatase [Candidatus Kapabacteria bacterium]|nr:UDP-2,3-diacylglucosamine diphosphatase [Candidatus Kapabacteria bacterium]